SSRRGFARTVACAARRPAAPHAGFRAPDVPTPRGVAFSLPGPRRPARPARTKRCRRRLGGGPRRCAMSRAMGRWMVAGALALAGVAGVGVDPVAAAGKPASGASPFAGTYLGYVPGSSGDYSITVSAAGKVSGAGSGTVYNWPAGPGGY